MKTFIAVDYEAWHKLMAMTADYSVFFYNYLQLSTLIKHQCMFA